MFLKSKIFRVQKMTWLDTSACFIRTSQSWKLIPSKLEKNPNHFNPKKNVYIITACFSKDQLVQMIFGVTQCNSIGIVFHVWPSKFERTKLLNFKTKDFACHKKKHQNTLIFSRATPAFVSTAWAPRILSWAKKLPKRWVRVLILSPKHLPKR